MKKLGLAGLFLAAAMPALAADYTIMAPAAPGGGWDQTARTMQNLMQTEGISGNVQVTNVPGAGGTIGLAQFVNVSKGDPNALMIGGQAMVAAVELNKSAVRVQQATPLARLVAEYSVIVVPANSPYKSMGDLVKALKENPGKGSCGAGSAGSTEHLLLGLIAKAVGVDTAKLNYIAFKGGGEAVPAIIGGHVAAGASGLGEFGEHIKSGKMRALAVSSPTAMEGIPSLKEQGIDVVFGNWRGIWGAPGITPAQRADLTAMVKAVTERPEWKGMLEKMGWSPVFLSGEPFEKFVNDESQSLGALVGSLGLRK